MDEKRSPKNFNELEELVVMLAARHGLNVDGIRKELRGPHLGAMICATYGLKRPRGKVGAPSRHEENLLDTAAVERHRRAGKTKSAACAAAFKERHAQGRRYISDSSFERAYDRMLKKTGKDAIFWFLDVSGSEPTELLG
jgi:hypothetical protein